MNHLREAVINFKGLKYLILYNSFFNGPSAGIALVGPVDENKIDSNLLHQPDLKGGAKEEQSSLKANAMTKDLNPLNSMQDFSGQTCLVMVAGS
jgi:hypothetical protein